MVTETIKFNISLDFKYQNGEIGMVPWKDRDSFHQAETLLLPDTFGLEL